MLRNRSTQRFSFLAGVAVGVLCCGSGLAQTIELQSEPVAGQTHPGFEVRGLTDDHLARVKSLQSADPPQPVLTAFVAGQTVPLMGTVLIADQRLVLQPRFPLAPGTTYEVELDAGAICGDDRPPIRSELSVPPAATAVPELANVYPSGQSVPQNLLRMYLRFTTPMRRGAASDAIRFLDADGNEIADAYLQIPQELWDESGQQFTILFDPGRIKRGLARHEELDLPFQVGQQVTLQVDRRWQSAGGKPLRETFRHAFVVVEPDRTQPDPQAWSMSIPQAGSRDPLVIDFGESLNRAMLDHALEVVHKNGEPVAGKIVIAENESRWQFSPDQTWPPGEYELVIDARLEDLAGNSLARPFEIEMRPGAAFEPDYSARRRTFVIEKN